LEKKETNALEMATKEDEEREKKEEETKIIYSS